LLREFVPEAENGQEARRGRRKDHAGTFQKT